MKKSNPAMVRVTRTEDVLSETWLTFRRKHFVDRLGAVQAWSYVERTRGQQAAVVIARTRESGRLILIRQFRIPLEAWVYEFPAGLVDPGETPESAALRELAEETGYSGEISAVSPAVPTSPGLCTETVFLVSVTAGETPAAHDHEAAESIEVLTLATDRESVAALLAKAQAEGSLVDSKLYTFLMQCL